MTDRPTHSSEPRLDAWMERRVAEAMTPPDAAIPLDRMWTRVSQAPRLVESGTAAVAAAAAAAAAEIPVLAPAAPSRPTRVVAPLLIAAGVLLGVAIGRFGFAGAGGRADSLRTAIRAESAGVPDTPPAPAAIADGNAAPPASPITPATTAALPNASAAPRRAGAGVGVGITPVVADHLQHTVALLAAVGDAEHAADADSVTRRQLQQLRITTRRLLDDPAMRGTRTYRLLEDLELVLAQLARARASAPATREAADETLRETNLLPRLRAAAEARSGSEE